MVGPLRNYGLLLLVLLVAGGIGAAVIMFFLIGKYLKPVQLLTRGAQRIADGDFEHTIASKTGDELQTLAQQFNTMAGTLKESYADLEQKVADRTEEVRRSEERYRSLFEESRDAIFLSDQGVVIAANEAALELFGFTREQAIGSNVGDRYADPEDQERFRREIEQEGSVRDFEVQLLKHDGTVMDCLLTATRRRSDTGEVTAELQGLVRDITERKRAEETLMQQTRELAVLEERNRMAREIHDTLAQGFTGIVLQLEAADQVLEGRAEEAADHLTRAKNVARESLQEARRSVWGLVPHALEETTLEDALRQRVAQVNATGPEKATFRTSGQPRVLPSDVQTAILRICQESLSNATRHAKAGDVAVTLSFDKAEVRLEVQDNGVGFDIDAARSEDGSGFGMVGMEQRASLLGGTISVNSVKGQGTTVEARVPVD